jgi:hypothetical protein
MDEMVVASTHMWAWSPVGTAFDFQGSGAASTLHQKIE